MHLHHFYLFIGLLSLFGNDHSVAKAPNHLLTCNKLDHILIHHPANEIRPFCNTAEIKCRALKMVEERPKKDILRQEVEGKLREELRYELDICEIALRKLDPSFLEDR